jgi:hypothetical protein
MTERITMRLMIVEIKLDLEKLVSGHLAPRLEMKARADEQVFSELVKPSVDISRRGELRKVEQLGNGL